MLDILKFVFADLWHFFGTLLLLGVLFDGVVAVIHAVAGRDGRPVAGRLRRSAWGQPG